MKIRNLSLFAIMCITCLFMAGCNKQTGIANPASEYCLDQGGTVEIETDEEGNESGICMFDDGSYCEEWSFQRGECQKGEIMYNTIE